MRKHTAIVFKAPNEYTVLTLWPGEATSTQGVALPEQRLDYMDLDDAKNYVIYTPLRIESQCVYSPTDNGVRVTYDYGGKTITIYCGSSCYSYALRSPVISAHFMSAAIFIVALHKNRYMMFDLNANARQVLLLAMDASWSDLTKQQVARFMMFS